jgi:hypothetical protein
MMLLRGALLLSGVEPLSLISRADVRFPPSDSIPILFATAARIEESCPHAFIARAPEALRSEGEQT